MKGASGLVLAVLLAACLGPSGQTRARKVSPGPVTSSPGMSFRSPLPGARVLSSFGKRGRRFHEGIDLKLSRGGGEPVLAAAAGRVVEAGLGRGYGRMVLIKHPNGWYTRYAHLRSYPVRKDQQVEAGAKIGAVGGTGRASTPHLHFELLTPQRRPVDPAPHIFKMKKVSWSPSGHSG